MSALTVPVPVLTKAERKELEAIVRKRTSAQRLVERAQIILLSADGHGIAETAGRLRVAINTVRRWRWRWVQRQGMEVADRLADEPRPGAPARITPEQICRIIALACEPPEKHGRPITHWTYQELADEAVKQGIAKRLSRGSVHRFLKSSRFEAPSQPLLADAQARRAAGRKNSRRVRDVRGGSGARRARRKDRVDR